MSDISLRLISEAHDMKARAYRDRETERQREVPGTGQHEAYYVEKACRERVCVFV